MKKLLKKIRYWLIGKLGGIPNDKIICQPIIRQENVKVEEVCSTVKITDIFFRDKPATLEFYKEIAMPEMYKALLKYIDVSVIDNPIDCVKVINTRIKVVRPGSSTWI